MSFGGHACRHALRPPVTSTLEHPWVSDNLLSATFSRFANGQRRHGSCVPGPMEARRRLARRRNTALAGIGGAPEDIACLFGRNGREHMKWTDHPWQRAHAEPHDSNSYSYTTAEALLPFYDHNSDPVYSNIPEKQTSTSGAGRKKKPSKGFTLRMSLRRDDWDIEDMRQLTRSLGINLQRDPRYSRQIFDKLLERSDTEMTTVIRFLDDPFMNTRGSGNYLAVVEMFLRERRTRNQRTAVMRAIARALELGLIPSEEVCLIVKSLPKILIEKGNRLENDPEALVRQYREMWTAIGQCNILGYGDMPKPLIDSWLEELRNLSRFRLAGEIISATHDASSDPYWPSAFVMKWLETLGEQESLLLSPKFFDIPASFLSRLDADCAAKCLIDITERLVSNRKMHSHNNKQLEQWQDCLRAFPNAPAIGSSQAWSDLPLAYMQNHQVVLDASPSSDSLSVQHQIVMRLWILRNLSRSKRPRLDHGPKATDFSIYLLLNMYEMNVLQTRGNLFADLLHDIHSLDMPFNSLLPFSVHLRLGTAVTNSRIEFLEKLEFSKVPLEDIWTNTHVHNRLQKLFFGAFEQMLSQIDLTDPKIMDEFLHLARIGDSNGITSLFRILSYHKAFKISVYGARFPISHPDEMKLVRYHSGPRDMKCPDPHVAVDFIHQLAVAFSCCSKMTPNRSFHLIHRLYDYLRLHGAPTYPSMARAMYHAGVVRFRREAVRLSPTRLHYVMGVVGRIEGWKVVKKLKAPPQIGEKCSSSDRK